MDLRAFEKNPVLMPLLVRLHENHQQYQVSGHANPALQAELAGTMIELMDVSLSLRERELMTDVLVTLMRQAEKDMRTALAERLAVIDTVPLRLALHLANDEISVAAPILRHSKVLSDMDLIYIIKSQGPEYWQAIAARETLEPQLIDLLAETKNPETAIALSRNDRVRLTEYALGILGDMAMKNEDIARPLLARPEMPDSLAAMLYNHVGAELKAYIKTYHVTLDEASTRTIDDVISEFSEISTSEFMPSTYTVSAAEKFAQLGMLNLNIMIEALQRGQIATFIAFFARYTGLPVQRTHDFLRQACPKGLAIACRAFGVQKADFSRIYLMTNRMRSTDRTINHKDMLEILSYFDKLTPEVAMRIVKRAADPSAPAVVH